MSSPLLVLLLVIFAGIAVVTLAIVLTLQSRRVRPAGPRKASSAGWVANDGGLSFDAGSADCSSDGGGGGCD